MEQLRQFTINSLRYDREVRRSWQCALVSSSDEMLELFGVFEWDVNHTELGLIKAGTRSVEYFYPDLWYNHFVFFEPDNSLRNHYLNICMPPEISDGLIEYIDLDIDVLVWPDGRVITLDVDEFEANAVEFQYPLEIRRKTFDTLSEITELIKTGSLSRLTTKIES